MNLTKGQIAMITNMVNCELSNSSTVYDMAELIVLKANLSTIKNEENLAKPICRCLPEGTSKKYKTLCVCAKCGLPNE